MKDNHHLIFFMLLVAVFSFAYADVPVHMQYIFPQDGSRLISRNTNIILRPGSLLDTQQTLSDPLIEVQGSKSGRHPGRVVIASDRQSILFYPDAPFEAQEQVTVRSKQTLRSAQNHEIAPFSFYFETTPLLKSDGADQYLESSKAMPAIDREFMEVDSLPKLNITVSGETAQGNLFLAPTQFFSADGYLLMTNDQGEKLFQETVEGKVPFDFKLQPNGLMSYGLLYEYFAFSGGGYTDFYIMDGDFSVIDEFQMGNGYIADFHDFIYLPNGNKILFGYDYQPVDMSDIVENGRPDAMVAGSIIQELDIENHVIFQWRSWDYFDLADSYNDLTNKNFDAIHINSVDVSNDGNLIVSVLALGEVTKIDRSNGEIIWRLGGKNSDFVFKNESEEFAPLYFMFQHDVRCLSNGHITMFDNGAKQFGREYSRVVEYAIDESAMTATKVWEYRHDPDIFVPTMGNAQRLTNGNTLIGWGFASLEEDKPVATEVDADGNVVMEMQFAESGFGSYRVFRQPFIGGDPTATVTRFEIQEGNTYEFINRTGDVKLGLTVTILAKPGFGYNELIGDYYDYGPVEPVFSGPAPRVLPMHFVLDQIAIGDLEMELYFDTEFLNIPNPDQIIVYYRMYENSGMFLGPDETGRLGETIYNPVTKKLKTTFTRIVPTGGYGMIGSQNEIGEFIFVYPVQSTATLAPILGSSVCRDSVNSTLPVELTWSPRGYANYYDLQVSSDSLFSNIVIDEVLLREAVYSFDALESGIRYYWRVRAYTDMDTSDWSTAWFETVPPFIEITSPASADVWSVGLRHFIEWEDNLEEDVVIRLYNNDTLKTVIDTVKSIGAYHWDIPFDLPLGSGYKIYVQSISDSNVFGWSDIFSMDSSTVEPVPTDFGLDQNFPNPLLSMTMISYYLPVESQVKIEVFNVLGQRVAILVDGWIGQGERQIFWQPGILGAGLYFYRMQATPLESDSGYASYSAIRKMIVLE